MAAMPSRGACTTIDFSPSGPDPAGTAREPTVPVVDPLVAGEGGCAAVNSGTSTDVTSRWAAAEHPFVYEINTWPWLDGLSAGADRRVELGCVPEARWDAIAELGFDAVWLMGVWTRSPAGVAVALSNPTLCAGFEEALPGYGPEDVVGSPYCVRDYVVDPHLGGPEGLTAARDALARRGLGLILDFVPNHVAPDHPWTSTRPGLLLQGSAEELVNEPGSFIEVGGRVLALGRDPFFPAWPDVVQLNAFSPELRAAVVETLRAIADQCDGVRCDMAMLVMNDTFSKTWGDRGGDRPGDDYWPTVIPAVHETHPDFRFLAEAYWDLEWELQQQGLDFCYDKRLYDRLIHEDGEQVRLHLLADHSYQDRLVRFVENHDEPRAASILDPAREKAAAVTTLTQTGARLVHDGQIEGRKVHLPMFLGRFPAEPSDGELVTFYETLLTALTDATFRTGQWQLCERSGWPGNETAENLVAWSWEGATRWLVVVNLSDAAATGHVRVPWDDVRGHQWRLLDPTHDTAFERAGDDLRDGLYVELGPWDWHLLRIEPAPDADGQESR
jgi:glycosidase